MPHVNDMHFLDSRRLNHPSNLRGFHDAPEEHAELQEIPLRAYEEITGPPREHDRAVRRVDPLVAEFASGLAQPLPRVPQIFGKVGGQRGFGGRPAIVLVTFLDPLFAVVALSTGHVVIVSGCSRDGGRASGCFWTASCQTLPTRVRTCAAHVRARRARSQIWLRGSQNRRPPGWCRYVTPFGTSG